MKKCIIILTCLLLAVATTLLITDSAPGKEPAVKPETGELKQAIEILDNPEKSKKLAEQLKILLRAQERIEADKIAPKAKIPSNLFRTYQYLKERFRSALQDIDAELEDLPFTPTGLETYLSKEENREELLSFLIKFLAAFFVAFLAWLGFRGLTRRLEGRLDLKEPFTLWKKMHTALVSVLLKVYPLVCLYLFIYFLLTVVALPDEVQSTIHYLLLAVLSYFTLKNLVYFLLSPQKGERRVIPVSDELAEYIFAWSRRIFLFSLFMSVFIIPSAIFDRPALEAAFSGILRIGLFVFITVILVQWKDRIGKAVCLTLTEEEPYYRRSAKRVCNYTVQKIYLVAIFYIGLILVLPIIGFPDLFSYIISSTTKSVLVLILAVGLSFLWNVLFERVVLWSRGLKEEYVDLQEHVNRYAALFKRMGSLLILLFAAITVVDIWGLHAYEFIGSNANLLRPVVRIPLIVVIALFLTKMTDQLIVRLERRVSSRMLARGKVSKLEVGKRVSTLGSIVSKAAFIAITTVTIMMILEELGFDIKPILAGAGVLGLAVGFGAQNLVRDIISGLFLIIENRIRVGDVAIINGTGGLVEQVTPRTTVLRGQDGTIHVFPNGTITTLSNMTYEFSFYVFNVGVAYKEDVDRVMAVLKEVGEDVMGDEEFGPSILEPLEILGVDAFADSAVTIKARIKTIPIQQWTVGREMNRRIKKRFDELGIEIPFPHRSLYFGEASGPISVKLEGAVGSREELKQLIVEVLRESGLTEPRERI